MKAKKQRILDEQMAKRLQDEELKHAPAKEKYEKEDLERAKMQEKHLDNIKKYQSLKRKPISVPQAKKNMIVYLNNMARYKIQQFKDRDEEPTKKRAAKETLLQESFKKLKAKVKVSVVEFKVEALKVKYQLIDWEIHLEGSRSYWKIIRVGGITEAYQSFEDLLKSFDREDLDALWRLVNEKFSITIPTVDREKALWVELKILYEPNAADVFWKLQRYMHDLLSWKLYTNCGVHQVTSIRRHHIFMLTEKDYPLTNVVLLLMLSAKLQVNEDCEMARDFIMKIFMEDKKSKRRISLDTSST
uniref:Uncharacterized protein n=1 Tax=Tanacetum cinerariifolium TaxID=118510 RepID=A0A6L2KT11_TANCI|nr:hypothetical protein [Tanacetum cinerariifolium]